MTLLIALVVSSSIIGAATPAIGRRTQAAIVGLAVLVTAAYLLFPARFM